MFMFLSSHGSSLIGLPFPLLGCLSVVFVYVTCVQCPGYIDVCSDLIRGDACSIL